MPRPYMHPLVIPQIHIPFHGSILHRPHPGGELANEIPVVHHRQHRALEGRHRLLEAGAAGDVQVVDRLVEQQAVAATRHQPRERQPCAFAVAQAAHRHEDVVPGEEEVVEERAHVRVGHRHRLAQGIEGRAIGIEVLLLLRVVTEFDVRAQADRAGECCDLPGDGAQQRRLAAAVRPDEGHALALP